MLINFNKFAGISSRPVENNISAKKSVKANASGGSESVENVDKIDISSSYRAFDINSLKNEITASVQKEASPEKLNEIKQQVDDGKYKVSSADLAAALMGYKIK